jgi:hypothetical protein
LKCRNQTPLWEVGTLKILPEIPPPKRGVWLIGTTVVPAETQARSVTFGARSIVISLSSLFLVSAKSCVPAGAHVSRISLRRRTPRRLPMISHARRIIRGRTRMGGETIKIGRQSLPPALRSRLRFSFQVVRVWKRSARVSPVVRRPEISSRENNLLP